MDDVKNLLTKLQAERAAILEKSQPLRDKRAALQTEMQPIEKQIQDLTEEIRTVETDRMFKLDMQISKLALALGAKSISTPVA